MTHYLKLLTFATLITAFSAHCEIEIKVQKQEETEVIANGKTKALLKKYGLATLASLCRWFNITSSMGVVALVPGALFVYATGHVELGARILRDVVYKLVPLCIITSNASKLFDELAPQT